MASGPHRFSPSGKDSQHHPEGEDTGSLGGVCPHPISGSPLPASPAGQLCAHPDVGAECPGQCGVQVRPGSRDPSQV